MKNKNFWLPIITLVCCLTLGTLLFLQDRQVYSESSYRVVMGTFAKILVTAKNEKQAKDCIEAGFAQIRLVESLMSDYKSDSEISRVNANAFKEPVRVSDATFEVLQKSIEHSKISDGAFDITVGPLVELWRKAGDSNTVPSAEELSKIAEKVGFEKLLLDNETKSVRFMVEGMKLDLGAIAKGYSIDKAVEAMKANGAVSGMVDIGGDIRCFGKPADRENWIIGLQDPSKPEEFIDTGKSLLVIKLTDEAVATSGDYQRFVTVGGKKHSHIIDRKKEDGAESLSSVTIIAKTAIDADALATTVSVLGAEKGLKLIEDTPDVEAILITSGPEYKMIKTNGADRFIKKSD